MIVRDISPGESKRAQRTLSLKNAGGKKTPAEKGRTQKRAEQKQSTTLIVDATTTDKRAATVRELSWVLGAACVILIVINAINLGAQGLHLKNTITASASAGFENIVGGTVALGESHFENARALFEEAQQTFRGIQNTTWFTEPTIPMLSIKDPLFEAARALTATGNHLATAGAQFSEIAEDLQFLPQDFFAANQKTASLQTRPSLTEKLKKELPLVQSASASLLQAHNEIQKIPPAFIPISVRDRFAFAEEALDMLSGVLHGLGDDIPALLALLGDQAPHTFLILLQNNAELRPTGGFIGSYMIIETNDGYLTKNEVHDIYSADHQLKEVLAPPAEILPVNTRWFMRDANYSGDFPLSAQKLAWFLEKENGPGVDSVIAIDPSFVSEFLLLTGPIRISDLAAPLTSDNFATVLSFMIESKLSGRENPKEILKKFIPEFQRAVFSKVDPVSLLPLLRAAAESKHMLAYSKDPVVQGFFERAGITGVMKALEPKEDYLNIVHTSIGGDKSDAYMREEITHDTYLRRDGSVVNEVAITRKHLWTRQSETRLRNTLAQFGFNSVSENILEILGASRNLHMLRIYVPKGSVLTESSDKNVKTLFDEETGKTYFSAQMMTPVGEAASLKLRYVLPFHLNLDPVDKYELTVQKQAGSDNVSLWKRILPESRILNYKYFPESGSFDAEGTWSYETELTNDLSFSSIWGK